MGTVSEAGPRLAVEAVETPLGAGDMNDLCDCTDLAIEKGGGFGWLTPPAREVLERYWTGVLVVPERTLYVARLDGVIAGSAQLVRPSRHAEAQAHAATLSTFFIAPWARGHGLARLALQTVEAAARSEGFAILNLDVRETQDAAIALYEASGYIQWGTHPYYARLDGEILTGRFYYKQLAPIGDSPPA